ncbi:hypothetical protein [Methylocystis parvus]|uniref:Uncharacterized protein n=1 Tax=Methylocystis parvus TaxID=134 RepID=A0A6B8MC05_9HYPH|nr:hypothetical protein [Methylocystis parvus]QGN00177.1 hypothetical protein F7D14_21685 [Methylocystis parvus]WBK02514.1 hypothetical protein MMG94_20950 [Methylocystis parvus OBBP]
MENEQRLANARKNREEIEAHAYRLPDGRMAFKTEDGLRVFDQNGTQLAPDTINPDGIPDNLPRWKGYQDVAAREHKLHHDRDELLRLQKRVDEAREELDKGGISSKRLDDLSADLQRDMPEAVQRKLAGDQTPAATEARSVTPGQGMRATGPVSGPSF